MDIAEFIRARRDEDEAVARRNIGAAPGTSNGLGDTEEFGPGWPDYQTYDDDDIKTAYDYLNTFRPLRMLREIEADRRLLAELERCQGDAGWDEALMLAARIRASAWSDHPGYRAEWAP